MNLNAPVSERKQKRIGNYVQVIKQVLEGVYYMHQQGVLHRDLKTENLRLTRPTEEWVADMDKMHIKIIDFGLSCRIADNPELGWLGSPGAAPYLVTIQYSLSAS